MTLALDARQRAMLLEMGVRVWPPLQGPAPAKARAVGAAPASAPAQAPRQPLQEAPPPPPRQSRAPLAPAAAAAAAAAQGTGTHSAAGAQRWCVQAPRLLYPDADPALTPPALGAGWLVVAEATAPDDPQAEKSERLLDAMLHALQLHHHPRVALCNVAPADDADAGEPDAGAAIARHVEAFAPSVVLVMGRGAVLAALGRSDPLGKLRSAELAIAGVPVVVTFSSLLLLRNPQAKPTAWADLCRARALAGHGACGPVP